MNHVTPVLAAYSDLPFALFGHSLGAKHAYEVGCELIKRGAPPFQIIVSGAAPPPVLSLKERYEKNPITRAPVATMSDKQLIDVLRGMGGTPKEILENQDMMDFLLPAIRADYHMYTLDNLYVHSIPLFHTACVCMFVFMQVRCV